MKLVCRACDYQGYPIEFVIKPVETTTGHTNLYHCPKCNSAMIKRVKNKIGGVK